VLNAVSGPALVHLPLSLPSCQAQREMLARRLAAQFDGGSGAGEGGLPPTYSKQVKSGLTAELAAAEAQLQLAHAEMATLAAAAEAAAAVQQQQQQLPQPTAAQRRHSVASRSSVAEKAAAMMAAAGVAGYQTQAHPSSSFLAAYPFTADAAPASLPALPEFRPQLSVLGAPPALADAIAATATPVLALCRSLQDRCTQGALLSYAAQCVFVQASGAGVWFKTGAQGDVVLARVGL
jgi:hypothetical protein